MDQKRKPFHHALRIIKKFARAARVVCVCAQRRRAVIDGKATLHPEWCIDCGECYKVCPVRAITVEDDDIAQIFKFKHRILLVPPSSLLNLKRNLPWKPLMEFFTNGLTELCMVEQGADLLIEINKYVEEFEGENLLFHPIVPPLSALYKYGSRLLQTRL